VPQGAGHAFHQRPMPGGRSIGEKSGQTADRRPPARDRSGGCGRRGPIGTRVLAPTGV
jgi:hypothetical protein